MRSELPEIWQGIKVTWDDVFAPEPGAIAKATRLLELVARKAPRPASASRGYWPTVTFHWPDHEVEVEVFATHCELYQFRNGNLLGTEIPKFKATRPGVATLVEALGSRGT